MKINPRGIEVFSTPDIHNALVSLFNREDRPEIIIESGTYMGTGTTKTVIDAILVVPDYKPKFYTIEVQDHFYDIARENLKQYGWVQLINGFSLGVKEAMRFVENDKMLMNHEKYPDIYVDVLPDEYDVTSFYLDNVREMTAKTSSENVLVDLIKSFRDTAKILFVLDSDGGIGFLEFKTVVKEMGDLGFFLFMDDAQDHIKHVRSGWSIRINYDKRWGVLFEDERIMIAERKKAEVNARVR